MRTTYSLNSNKRKAWRTSSSIAVFLLGLFLSLWQTTDLNAQVKTMNHSLEKQKVERIRETRSIYSAPDQLIVPDGMTAKSFAASLYNSAVGALRTDSDSNPDLPPNTSCTNLDVIFVLDESGSINSTEAANVENGALALANALNNSGASLRIVEFATTASVVNLGVTTVNNTFVNRFTNYLTSSYNSQSYNPVSSGNCTGWTNWEDALEEVIGLEGDLVIFFTDGNPTAYNRSGECGVRTPNDGNYSASEALNRAIAEANLIKAQGKHMFGIGIGSDLNIDNIKAISGDDNFAINGDIFTDDYSIGDFEDLASQLAAVVNVICGTELEIEKSVSQSGVCAGEQVTFTISVTNTGGLYDYQAINVRIEDEFPSGFSNLQIVAPAPNGSSISGNTLTYNAGNLTADQTVSIQVTATVGVPPANFDNLATAIADNANEVSDNATVSSGFSTGIDQQAACASYTWIDGVTYTESTNTPTFLFPGASAAGCDSLVTLNLTIIPQPQQPVLECWQNAEFNSTTCSWDVSGEQPAQPTLACYETADFNTTTCSWDVTGDMPAEPQTACYETANFNTTTCAWDVTGDMPAEPQTACYETANFNTTTCAWDVTGDMPVEPQVECYEVASFNTTSCSWDVTGEPNEVIASEITECDSYTWSVNGETYTSTGVYTYSQDCQNYELNLTINESSAITNISATINEGDSYEFDGNLLTAEGEYTAYFQNAAQCDSTVILTLTVIPNQDGCLGAEVYAFNQGLRKDGNAVLPERSIPGRVLGAPDAQNPSVMAPEQFFFSLGFGGSIEIDFGYGIANGPGNDIKIWESSASPNAEKARIEVSQDGLGYVPVGEVAQGGEVDFGGAFADYIRFVRIVDISNPAEFGNSITTDGYDVDAVECIHGRYVQPNCVGVEAFNINQGKQANGEDVVAERSVVDNALDLPVAAPVGTVDFYALGFGGHITLAFDGPIANGPGADVRVVETTWNYTAEDYPETANVFASQDGVNFVFLGSTVHSGEFDLGVLSWAQYIKIMDASDASLFPADADGYDLNGIECLNGSADNPGDDGLVPCTAQGFSNYVPGAQKNGDAISGMRNDPAKALDGPQYGDNYNFVSLGFGGSLELAFDYVVFNNDGDDIQIVETSFGNPSCLNYPEHAKVEGSFDNVSWTDLGEICLDGSIDLGSMTFVQFIRITDISDINSSRFGGSADGFDIDAVIALGPCYNAGARMAGDNNSTPDEVKTIGLYPNPADDFTVIRIDGTKADEKMILEVFDTAGRLVYAEQVTSLNNQTNIRLNVNDYALGVYTISVSTSTERLVQRLVK